MKQFLAGFMIMALAAAMLPGMGLTGLAITGVLMTLALAGRFDRLSITRKWFDHTAGSVTVTEANGQLGGTVTINDRVVGMVLTGATEGSYTAGTPLLVTSLTDVVTAGITATGNAFAYRHCKEFYDQAPLGAQLYLMLVPSTITIADMADNTNVNGARKLLVFAAGKIKVLGLLADDKAINTAGGTITIANGLNADVYTAANSVKIMEAAFRAEQKPFRAIIGGSSYSGVASALVDESTGTTNNKAAILIGDTISYDATYSSACVGLLMGKVASNGVQVKVSRVKDGPLTNTTAYLKTTPLASTSNDAATIAGRNFITWVTYPNVSGFFFSGDPMLCARTDDYWFLARGRVIDKAHVIAYTTFVNEVDDDIPTVEGGKPNIGWCKWMEQQITGQVSNTMLVNNEISGVDCYIDTDQNVVSTSTLNVVLKIRPKGYLTYINVSLGFQL